MKLTRILMGIIAVVLLAAAIVVWLNLRDEDPVAESPAAFTPTAAQIERGQYLARAGSCASCHTARGGAPFAGGFAIATPFGTVYASNLTPDDKTGLGRWNADHFWRALHNGRSKDGHLLYPAFPYPNYTRVTRADADALFAYLRSLPPVAQANRAHQLDFPFDTQLALGVWRALFFTPQPGAGDPAQSAEWNRGAYLVDGLGHCNACHSARNAFGATRSGLDLSGGLIPIQNWYAPSLSAPDEAGVQQESIADIAALLKTGRSPHAAVMGPMAEVVYRSTQYLDDSDARAVATFLKALPATASTSAGAAAASSLMDSGARLYDQHCKQCHGSQGEGVPGAYPPLAGNRAVTMPIPANVIRIVLSGGYLPSTEGNPRPYGMPPFAPVLSNADVAAVSTYVRQAWGNHGAPVSALDVVTFR
jgi:mono/diheme cytochrome c family protein